MRLLKSGIFIFCFSILAVAAFAQTGTDSLTTENTINTKRLAEYRQKFWDSLPEPVSWTNDFIFLFSPEQRDYLDSLVTDFEKKTTTEIAIVTLDTFCTAIENFDTLSLHIASKWGIGKKDKNNGIIICISPLYRRIRINYGTGIQKYLTDEETQNIIHNYIIPEYKNSNYFAGTAYGLRAIIDTLAVRLKIE